MDKSQALIKATDYANLVSEIIKPIKVVLYCSYVKGNWKEESDIDIAVIVDTIDDDFLEMEALLYKLRRDIDDRIEPILLEEGNDKSGFLEEILKNGQILYCA
ncbi:nucleotidyltransferase domain-containing protein [Heliorestis acidaminivorans]|uniref:Nucleotidyltransferase domain-containing protein n=1 Tax=Heliorestis acidaminivorans TaxID=553427 RepID=A0A6I0F0P4_9FIRM|nr:nucleotidyltransferase domain-containing protein [Heliorestis acidaminivorans]KAB2951924.1 nucleotidyltransferase domain-containing protein [Heliorestis acidaminivorans]